MSKGNGQKRYLGASGEVLAGFEISTDALSAYLRDHSPDSGRNLTLRQFQGGQSNPTYLVNTHDGTYVLRRRPPGILLASAHAIDREYRVISALHKAGMPVPRPIAYCDDETVIGSAFYLMEHVSGRIFFDNALPDLSPGQRGAIYEAATDTLSKLHSLDPVAIGLEDFGRSANYLGRQVSRWSRQYEASKTIDIPAMDRVIAWLTDNIPPDKPARVVHGDYSLHNLIFHPDRAEVAAILDWELATLGDPLADLTYHGMEWSRPAGIDPRGSLIDKDLTALGIPAFDVIVQRYCAKTGRDGIANLGYYKAFNLFRVAAIIQGVVARQLAGNAVDPEAIEQASRVAPLAEAAWAEAVKAGAK
ncbi:MAG: phosphotransferase family protein [Novosphingobium sp.]